jgi:hypothetical protein
MLRKLIIAIFTVFMMASLAAAEMPNDLTINSEVLKLNGHGIRTKYFFRVYNGGLYLQQNGQSDAQTIIQADEPMAIRMHWLRDVPAKNLIDGWNTGFSNATNTNTSPLQDRIDRFNAVFQEGVKENDIHDILYLPDRGVTIYKNGSAVEQIEGKDFKDAVFGIWLSEKTEVPDVRNKMLGN